MEQKRQQHFRKYSSVLSNLKNSANHDNLKIKKNECKKKKKKKNRLIKKIVTDKNVYAINNISKQIKYPANIMFYICIYIS